MQIDETKNMAQIIIESDESHTVQQFACLGTMFAHRSVTESFLQLQPYKTNKSKLMESNDKSVLLRQEPPNVWFRASLGVLSYAGD